MANYELKNESGIKDFTPSGTQIYAGDTITNTYSGATKGIKLPPGVYLFECWGAQGGTPYGGSASSAGGKGGYTKGTFTVPQESTFFLSSGGAGKQGTSSSSTTTISGGFNGGGDSVGGGASGGGASDICLGRTDLSARIIVAGGGGGGARYGSSVVSVGGSGGNTTGGSGGISGSGTAANGGAQSAGGTGARSSSVVGGSGSLLYGGGVSRDGPISGSSGGPGAGGGGYYGGGGGITNISASPYVAASGAGGSSYISSDFTDTDMQSGTRSGNGHIVITVISPTLGFAAYYKTSNSWKQISKAFVKVSGSWKNISKMYYKVNGSWHLIGGGSPGPGPTPTSAELHVYAPGATAIWAMNGSTRADGVQDTEATGYWNIPVSIGTWNVNGTKARQSAAVKSVSVTSEQRYTINNLCYASTTLDNTYWIFNNNVWSATTPSTTWSPKVYCDIEIYNTSTSQYQTYSNDDTYAITLLNPLIQYQHGTGIIGSTTYSQLAVIKTDEKYSTTNLPSYVYYRPAYVRYLAYAYWGVQYDTDPKTTGVSISSTSKGLAVHITGNVLFESEWSDITAYKTFLQNNATNYSTASAWKTAVDALT